jgi:protein-S-isoprenylcysteine O-methyltransferase Ste14
VINPGLRERLNRLRVRAGSFLAVAVLILARPNWTSLGRGILVAAVGLGIRAWASGHLRKEKSLAVSGPYRYSRNPLYLGNFVLGAGVVVTARSWWVLGLFAVYFGAFYPLMIQREGERLRQLFPAEYEEYGKRVPLFFPSLRKRHLSTPGRFSWPLYLHNKEFRAPLGVAVFWLALVAKMFLLKR